MIMKKLKVLYFNTTEHSAATGKNNLYLHVFNMERCLCYEVLKNSKLQNSMQNSMTTFP